MAERKKPKPPVPGKPKPTPAKKKPAAQVPVTSVTPRSTVKKPSAKQVAGTRKVVANLAGATPIGRITKISKGLVKAKKREAKQDFSPSEFLPRYKGKNKNLKKQMETWWASDITGQPGTRISKSKIKRRLPKPPIKKK
jgi:hypothetical protein